MSNDDDLIRRGDALAVAMPVGHKRDSYVTRGEMADRIAALPAVTVGVPTEADREWIDARADELFREAERRRGTVTINTTRPQDFRDYFVVNATLERFAALEPQPAPDAAAIREAALREAIAVAEKAESEWWSEYKDIKSPHAYSPHREGMSDGATDLVERLTALLTEKPHDRA